MTPTLAQPPAAADLPKALLQRFDRPGPRYTSYPTTDRFHGGVGTADVHSAMARRGVRSAPMSVHVHVPFCASVCHCCAFNKSVTCQHHRAARYIDALETEIAEVTCRLAGQPTVSQLHLGGGSPTFLSDAELARLVDALRSAFRLTPEAEISIDVDARTVTSARLAHLRALGVNRLSFAVHDTDPQVQPAVHGVQPIELVESLMRSARSLGFESINADLLHGLPQQTPESFARTVQQIGALRPDRIALYGHAHLLQRFKPQRRIDVAGLPAPAQRIAMLGMAIDDLGGCGYAYIGMDHFALHGDPLAMAQRRGSLHRNFRGYSTQPECDVIGLGVSSIGRIGRAHYQNETSLDRYLERALGGELPVERGLLANHEDRLRHDVIMALMCQSRVDFGPIERRHAIVMRMHFAEELKAMKALEEAGLVVIDAAALKVTQTGRFLVREIAMVFDAHLNGDLATERFLRLV